MSLFLETIQLINGQLQNLHFHDQRFRETRKVHFGILEQFSLKDLIRIPGRHAQGLVKCSITYNSRIRKIDFTAYEFKDIRKIRFVEKELSYAYKYADRKIINTLLRNASGCDEIIITREGYLTDTSFSNILLSKNNRWFTPEEPLLRGTKRALLLSLGMIHETDIHKDSLHEYEDIMFINAMMDFDENRSMPLSRLKIE